VSVLLVTLGLMVPPGDPAPPLAPGFLSLGLCALALLCTERARRAVLAAPRQAANRAA
jgi:hypothetical protein